MNYKEVKESALNFGAGLRFHLGQQPKGLITIYAETRAEWMISCFGAYTQVINKKQSLDKFEENETTVSTLLVKTPLFLSEYWSWYCLHQSRR